MSRPKFIISALGCKVSQYDAAVLKRLLLEKGLEFSNKNPDLVIINTCSVTKNAISKDKQVIKKFKELFPAAKLVVMGCWPQTNDNLAKEVPDILFWGVGEINALAEKIAAFFPDLEKVTNFEAGLLVSSDKSRYFLKVGDGCNQFCSYCLIPYARGPITSRPLSELVLEVSAAVEAGYGEIVLSGIHLGRYGQDLKNGESLISLLQALIAIPKLGRLRLSSIEVNEVSDELINLMLSNDKICQHLHISLQSGCDKILKLMKRPYDTAYFEERLSKLRLAMPNIAISTDIIVGFPGETAQDFVDTCRFAESMAFSKIHVFSFSAHEKTAAYQLPDRVPGDKIKQRSKILRDISSELENNYETETLRKLQGKKIKVIIEHIRGGNVKGKTEFYFDIPILVSGKVGTLVEVEL